MEWLALFGSAFLAATLVPFYSELILFAMARQGESAGLLVLVATAGNTLGAVVNWILGRYLVHFQNRRWFPCKPDQLKRSQDWFQRYGVWSLLLAWLPIGGDGLTFIAGMMRVRLGIFLVLVGLGKMARYVVVLYTAQLTIDWW